MFKYFNIYIDHETKLYHAEFLMDSGYYDMFDTKVNAEYPAPTNNFDEIKEKSKKYSEALIVASDELRNNKDYIEWQEHLYNKFKKIINFETSILSYRCLFLLKAYQSKDTKTI